MSRDLPKSRYRPKPDPAAPFHVVLDQLGQREDAPGGSISRRHAAPQPDWPYPAAEAVPACAVDATAELYLDTAMAQTTPDAAPRSVEEAVALELQLSDDIEPAALERIRRTFAYRNHPDRVGPAHKARALQRMTVANVLIDRALEAARTRAR